MQTTITQFDLLIGGKVVPASNGEYFGALNPSNNKIFAQIANGSLKDAKNAVKAAREAFDKGVWPTMTLAERGIYLKKIAQGIRKAAKELAEIESLDTGKTLKQSTFIDVPTCADTFDYFSRMSDKVMVKDVAIDAPVKGTLYREPYGVVVAIIPWNYPLIMAAWKIAPAIMAGNTVVFKPASVASASILMLGKIIQESGLPEGVVNILTTSHHDVGSALIDDDDVDLISFTGGSETDA